MTVFFGDFIRRSYRSILVALVAIATIPAASADDGQVLRGSMFVSVLSGNTMSGTTPSGAEFHVYFLSGGVATFVDENERMDVGRWRIRQEDDAVCVQWQTLVSEEQCAVVTMEGSTLTLEGDVPVGQVELLGTIVTEFD